MYRVHQIFEPNLKMIQSILNRQLIIVHMLLHQCFLNHIYIYIYIYIYMYLDIYFQHVPASYSFLKKFRLYASI